MAKCKVWATQQLVDALFLRIVYYMYTASNIDSNKFATSDL